MKSDEGSHDDEQITQIEPLEKITLSHISYTR